MKTRRRLSSDTLERIERVLARLQDENLSVPIIVEGLHDVKALRAVGFTGEIFHMNTGRSIVNFATFISQAHSEVILLMDFDRKGCELTKKLVLALEDNDVACHTEQWRQLRAILGSEIAEIEELPDLLHREKII